MMPSDVMYFHQLQLGDRFVIRFGDRDLPGFVYEKLSGSTAEQTFRVSDATLPASGVRTYQSLVPIGPRQRVRRVE